jgi:CBS domain-containing membrane protein
VALTGLVAALIHGDGEALPWLATSMGSAAVLVFVLPASPLAQPWPVVGGNSLSALIGFAIGSWLGHGAIACGIGVALAIAMMSMTRTLHPPGGASALAGVIGGGLVTPAGWWFWLAPVALDAVILVGLGLLFHRFVSRHPYPHRDHHAAPTADPAPSERVGISDADLDAVLARVGETYDIERADLRNLLSQLEIEVLAHRRPDLTCGALMSRDVISVDRGTDPEQARRILLDSGVRLLPVLDDGRPVGGVGLRELARPAKTVADVMAPPLTIHPSAPAVELIPALTDGHRHAAMVVDPDAGTLRGLVTQADLLAALASLSAGA